MDENDETKEIEARGFGRGLSFAVLLFCLAGLGGGLVGALIRGEIVYVLFGLAVGAVLALFSAILIVQQNKRDREREHALRDQPRHPTIS